MSKPIPTEVSVACSCHACRDAVAGEPAPLCAVANALADELAAILDVDRAAVGRVVLEVLARHVRVADAPREDL